MIEKPTHHDNTLSLFYSFIYSQKIKFNVDTQMYIFVVSIPLSKVQIVILLLIKKKDTDFLHCFDNTVILLSLIN